MVQLSKLSKTIETIEHDLCSRQLSVPSSKIVNWEPLFVCLSPIIRSVMDYLDAIMNELYDCFMCVCVFVCSIICDTYSFLASRCIPHIAR